MKLGNRITRLLGAGSILLIVLIFIIYKKHHFYRIYKNENDGIYGRIYSDIYSSKRLNLLKTFLISYYDSINTTENKVFTVRINTDDISDMSNDSILIAASNYLKENNFHVAYIEYDSLEKSYQVFFENLFLRYKYNPIFHYLVYDEKSTNHKYRYNNNDSWYFISIKGDNLLCTDLDPDFLDPRPTWLLPYFEAFEFFSRYPDFEKKIEEFENPKKSL